MKAIDLCERLIDGWIPIESAGMMTMNCEEERFMDKYCEGYFGTTGKWNGKRYAGEVYFYMYFPIDDEVMAYKSVGELPDAYSIRENENDIVALWRVE